MKTSVIAVCLLAWCSLTPVTCRKIEIISPKDGSRIDPSLNKGFALHVKVHDFPIPTEGHGKIFLDDEMIAVMDESEVCEVVLSAISLIPSEFPQAYFEVGNLSEILPGEHVITLRLYDHDESLVGIESSSRFELVSQAQSSPGVSRPSEGRAGGQQEHDRQQNTRDEDPCLVDLSKTTVSGISVASHPAGRG
eukprot:768399-Hanusia_phi.AAC.2